MFVERLAREDFSDRTVLDLGTGTGRLALYLAPRAGRVVGIDTDEGALAAARDRARTLRASNVTFVPADADTANYRLIVRSPLDFVVANHFMSEGAVRATSVALRTNGRFLFATAPSAPVIEWSGGRVDPGAFYEFAFLGRVAPDARPGSELVFPVRLTRASGSTVDWARGGAGRPPTVSIQGSTAISGAGAFALAGAAAGRPG